MWWEGEQRALLLGLSVRFEYIFHGQESKRVSMRDLLQLGGESGFSHALYTSPVNPPELVQQY